MNNIKERFKLAIKVNGKYLVTSTFSVGIGHVKMLLELYNTYNKAKYFIQYADPHPRVYSSIINSEIKSVGYFYVFEDDIWWIYLNKHDKQVLSEKVNESVVVSLTKESFLDEIVKYLRNIISLSHLM